MNKTIEVKAIDKEKAIERALKILEIKLKENEEVKVLEKVSPKKKLFGLLGTEPGVYEVSVQLKENNNNPNLEKKSDKEKEVKIEKEIKKEEDIVKVEKNTDYKANEIFDKAKMLLEQMSIELDIEVKRIKEKSYLLNLTGKDNAIIIGQKGKTLNSFEYLLNSLIKDCRIEVDVENFKEKRNETLRALGKKMAEKVLKTGKTIRLNAMPPRERKVIHEVINKYSNLDTFSEGRDPKRYIVIKKKK